MKLPLHEIVSPVLKPHFKDASLFCSKPMFAVSRLYVHVYAALGLYHRAREFCSVLGDIPVRPDSTMLAYSHRLSRWDATIQARDLKIVANAVGILQYLCLLLGCITNNPALYLPQLLGAFLTCLVSCLNIVLVVISQDRCIKRNLVGKVTSVLVMIWNWSQEFCAWSKCLCACDL